MPAVIAELCLVYNDWSSNETEFYVWSKEGRYAKEVDGCSENG